MAWQSKRNPTAIAAGSLSGRKLKIASVHEQLYTANAVLETLTNVPNLRGIAIDAPLIIKNQSGQRDCEKAIGREYGSRHASCHTSNLTKFPDSDAALLSERLVAEGFTHLGSTSECWQIECYPHPALIELFKLPMRLPYKRGRVGEKRSGQATLARLLSSLSGEGYLTLEVPEGFRHYFDPDYIAQLKGKALKHNEDVLDSVICLIVAAFYQLGMQDRVFGSAGDGYIYVPEVEQLP
ncbi:MULTISPECIES: DUF429 domain-containing protein [Marinobacter]|uniref:DUF429 domain-containing protein n=1 Tax=Marinobacter TaxID=2742 RepID=UPI001D0D22B4|nr:MULTISPECIES: DUF429 domain-containing protein [unclassified Marinobacter]